MILSETRLKVLDNSGALTAKCFRVYGKKTASLGSVIVVSIQTFRTGKRVKKGEVYKGIVIATAFNKRRVFGNFIKFQHNGLVLWKRKEDSPVGTRVLSYVPFELRFNGFLKIILISLGSF